VLTFGEFLLEGEPLNESSKELLQVSAGVLENFLQKYGVRQEISADQAEKSLAQSPNNVFSTISCLNQTSYELTSGIVSARVEAQLCSGIHPNENTLAYYASEHPYEEKEDCWIDIEFMFSCETCLEEQQEYGEADCNDCGRADGNLMYSLLWNQSGNVTIERTDPEDF
jgi:hypothetical protein